MGNEMVNIYVGEGETKRPFAVHKNVICDKMEYFAKIFRGEFEEAKTSVATFPEDDPDSFDLLLSWVYEGSLRELVNIAAGGEGETHTLNWGPCRLYALAEKLCLPELMDEAIDAYRQYNKYGRALSNVSAVTIGYQLTSSGSLYPKYLAQCWAFYHAQAWKQRG